MEALNVYLSSKGCGKLEGHCGQVPPQQEDLVALVSDPSIKRILEIGFNAGHSADLFLRTNPAASLVSFDLGSHDYVAHAKAYIDATYPGRHTLILGNSMETVPAYAAANPGAIFDLFFIDGGHYAPVPAADLANCLALAVPGATIVMDDVNMTDVAAAWEAAKKGGSVEPIHGRRYNGHGSRSMAWAKRSDCKRSDYERSG
jgi:predicted O-methyltransferase YrrM